jgi:hypothetical protein
MTVGCTGLRGMNFIPTSVEASILKTLWWVISDSHKTLREPYISSPSHGSMTHSSSHFPCKLHSLTNISLPTYPTFTLVLMSHMGITRYKCLA